MIKRDKTLPSFSSVFEFSYLLMLLGWPVKCITRNMKKLMYPRNITPSGKQTISLQTVK